MTETTGSTRSTRDASVRNRRRRGDALWAVVLIGPMFVGLVVFYVVPTIETLLFSFTKWGTFGGRSWTGLSNYVEVLTDADFYRALLHTLAYGTLALLAIPLAIVIAALLNQDKLRGRSLFRVLFFLPVVTMPVAVGLLWRLILNGEFGYLNGALAIVGIDGPAWLFDARTVILALGIVGIWSVLGYDVILFLAGLQTINRDMYEAATLDGAGWNRQFRSITLPLLSPTTFFVCIISTIAALQVFDLIYIMVGPTSAALPNAETVMYLFYRTAFVENDKGLASAMVFLLLLLIVGLTLLQFWVQRRWVHYE